MRNTAWFKEDGPEKPTTRSQRRIFNALAAKGYEATQIVWIPMGPCLEMQGPEGGWEIRLDWPADKDPDCTDYWLEYVETFLGGFNLGEVLKQIEELPPLKEIV